MVAPAVAIFAAIRPRLIFAAGKVQPWDAGEEEISPHLEMSRCPFSTARPKQKMLSDWKEDMAAKKPLREDTLARSDPSVRRPDMLTPEVGMYGGTKAKPSVSSPGPAALL